LETKEGLIVLTATTCVVVISMAVGCVVCCLFYRLPYCPRYVGRWFQDPAQAAAARRSLNQAINSPCSWRLRRVRPRRRQVLIFFVMHVLYTSPFVVAVSSSPICVEKRVVFGCTSSCLMHVSSAHLLACEINCFLFFSSSTTTSTLSGACRMTWKWPICPSCPLCPGALRLLSLLLTLLVLLGGDLVCRLLLLLQIR